MQVRTATPNDLDTIVAFILEEAREAEGRLPARDTLLAGVGTGLNDPAIASYWVLVDAESKACGCTSVIKEWSDWNAGYYWWIQSMYIAADQRGKGNLERLLDTITAAAREQGALDLRLYVHRDNPAAVRAYAKAGFEDSPYQIMTRALCTRGA